MGENDNLRLQQEINKNMTVASEQQFAMSNEEHAFSLQQQLRGAFNRSSRRKTEQQKLDQKRQTQNWVNKSNAGNFLDIQNAGNSMMTQDWTKGKKQEFVDPNQQNNRASSESIETIRENLKNSRESLKKRSCESLTIEEASMRNRTGSFGSNRQINVKKEENIHEHAGVNNYSNKNSTGSINAIEQKMCEGNKVPEIPEKETAYDSTNNKIDSAKEDKQYTMVHGKEKTHVDENRKVSYQDLSTNRRTCMNSTDSLNESTYDLSRSYRSLSMNDPYTAAIDLSNKCRQFYFNHQKAAEAIKQSVRSAKHERAKEKMEGKPRSGIDNAMDRLRSEMADLMDQDLSLMSQLLKLNDKIEEVKSHVAYKHRQEEFSSQSSCNFSSSEMSDSETEDFDYSRLDLSQSARNFKTITASEVFEEREPQTEVVLRRLEPTESQIIVYKKKKTRKAKRRKSKRSQSRPETEEDTGGESDDDESASDSLSGTESTLSCNSSTTINGSDQSDGSEQNSEVIDSGIQSPKSPKPEEPSTPKKGGVSQNEKFLKFHKKNGNFTKSILTGLNVITMQGHNIPLDKYYVPQGLVYLKQEKSDNVFCQFTK